VLEAVSSSLPGATLPRTALVGVPLVDVMVRAGLQKSKGEARRLIANGGAYVNDEKVSDSGRTIEATDLIEGRLLLLAAGKKNKMLVRVSDT
jgi:tyrosyl-tRNA synthetase